jgi:hypothetical protein
MGGSRRRVKLKQTPPYRGASGSRRVSSLFRHRWVLWWWGRTGSLNSIHTLVQLKKERRILPASRHRRRCQKKQLLSKIFISKMKNDLRKNNIPVPKRCQYLTGLCCLLVVVTR